VQNLFQIGVFLSQFEENRHNRQISLSVGVNEMGFKGVMFTENHARKPPSVMGDEWCLIGFKFYTIGSLEL